MEVPFFIVGANRSGTTLLRLILNAHSRLAVPEELNYFGSYVAGVPIERWRAPGLPPDRYDRFVSRFLKGNCRSLERLDRPSLKQEILRGSMDLRRPYRLVLEHWTRRHGKQRWGEKTPGNLYYADIILEMFPEAKFIHMVRDPRAGVRSMMDTHIFPDDVVFNALNRHKHTTVGRAFLEQHVPPSQRTMLRYEDLVTRPETTVRSICDFLGESYEPAMLRFHEDAGRYMKEEAVSSFNKAATRPISADKVDTWRHQLTSTEIAIIEQICADDLRVLGYAPEDPPLSLREHLHIGLKTAYWTLQTWRHRNVRHYAVRYSMFARTRRRLRDLLKALVQRP